MSDPQDRFGLFLSGMSWFSEVQAESRLIPGKWEAWRQAAQKDSPPPTHSLTKRGIIACFTQAPVQRPNISWETDLVASPFLLS
jgi:hypothetical protein